MEDENNEQIVNEMSADKQKECNGKDPFQSQPKAKFQLKCPKCPKQFFGKKCMPRTNIASHIVILHYPDEFNAEFIKGYGMSNKCKTCGKINAKKNRKTHFLQHVPH